MEDQLPRDQQIINHTKRGSGSVGLKRELASSYIVNHGKVPELISG
jgi:hypothetical protein